MGFFTDLIKNFTDATKAGADFNPAIAGLMEKLETMHSEGKLNDVIYQAEQAFKKEHEEYAAKGTHTNAADSKKDVDAMKHFLDALHAGKDKLDPALHGDVDNLLGMREKMEGIIGKFLPK